VNSILFAIAVTATLIPQPEPAELAWVTSGEFCEPETVLPLPDNTLLISNVCNFRETGNGFLTLLDASGEVIDWRIVEGLDAPLGMALHDGQLYLVDNNRIKVFSWPGYQPLNSIDVDTVVANDLAVGPDGTVYVTDTAGHKVVVVAPDETQSTLTDQAQFQGANGIHIEGKVLYVGGLRLWRIDLENNDVVTIGPEWLSDIDGIEMEPSGLLQITPVDGPLVRYCNDTHYEILGGEGIGSANHGYAANLGLALIPTGFDNTVIAIRIDDNEGPLKTSAEHPGDCVR